MPIKPENKVRYPKNWSEIREMVRRRADSCCEGCGVRDHAVGYRDAEGVFHPTAGNAVHDAAGYGRLPLAEARRLVEHANDCGGLGPNDERAVVIICTTAHLDGVPENCDLDNLRFWCQRCHNRHDAPMRQRNAAETRLKRKAAGSLFPELVR